ncbi:hypothetical protein HN958_04760 [Candidatus Falkowbacteria bacterium]|jgi:hypothetical protein|nr:hypothetical protein [Candidatus Falkowbacteria bacterium]
MKVLVIDDSPLNQESARQTITDHDLTVVGTYDEAYDLLLVSFHGRPQCNEPFEVVLTDLLMPAGSRNQCGPGKEFVGQEMPVGFALALNAVLHGAKYVGVVSMGEHHHHPALAMLDRLGSYGGWNDRSPTGPTPVRFNMNGAKVGFFPLWGGRIQVEGFACPACNGEGECRVHDNADGTVNWDYGKDWGKILTHLINSPVEPDGYVLS